ncbi:hypothetical protein TCA2_5995 [Paenibacillus sp. TCA20]|uniref:hypothetical protein n=1 Tax=Paenibacillus sp. TCA20 TaxID=1499968 RepID=UPI0004D415CC|nr:hypothetical protein [Paenibacillus sp. TCA20]GAK43497.1 hypothetical protein TCA2_5995 [Paenibacillus sp. TCA20]
MIGLLRQRPALVVGLIVNSEAHVKAIQGLFPPENHKNMLFLTLSALDLTDNSKRYVTMVGNIAHHLIICLDPGQVADALIPVFKEWVPSAEEVVLDTPLLECTKEYLNDQIFEAYRFTVKEKIRSKELIPCLICNKLTYVIDSCWFVPLCSDECSAKWEKHHEKKLRRLRK